MSDNTEKVECDHCHERVCTNLDRVDGEYVCSECYTGLYCINCGGYIAECDCGYWDIEDK